MINRIQPEFNTILRGITTVVFAMWFVVSCCPIRAQEDPPGKEEGADAGTIVPRHQGIGPGDCGDVIHRRQAADFARLQVVSPQQLVGFKPQAAGFMRNDIPAIATSPVTPPAGSRAGGGRGCLHRRTALRNRGRRNGTDRDETDPQPGYLRHGRCPA